MDITFGLFEDNIKETLGNIVKSLTNEIQHIVSNRILEYQTEEFRRNLYTKTLLHRAEPKNLFEFYVPLFLRKVDNKLTNKVISKLSTTSACELFKTAKRITLIGSAGSGKSTLVRYLFINCIKEKYKIPIKVELRYLNEFDGSLINYIKEQIFKLDKLSDNDKIIDRLLSSGKFVIFLDGYDEINTADRERVTKEIDDLVRIYNKNNYILTSRPYTSIDLLPSFHNFNVCDLSLEEIDEFVRKQLPNDEKELAEKIVNAVHKEENKAFKSFLNNPLLLSMFILSFQSYANIPQKRNIFYKQVFDALYSLHDSMSKLAFVREKQSGLTKEKFEEVLRLFSFISFFEEKFVFTASYLEEKLMQIKERKKNIDFDNDKLIQDLQVAIGILNKEGLEFTFPHRSLQEFFAAEYIANLKNSHSNKLTYEKLYEKIVTLPHILLENSNFYSLLKEMDNNNFVRYIVLPFLNQTVGNLKNAINCNEVYKQYFAFGEIMIFYKSVLQENIDLKDFFFAEMTMPMPYIYFRIPRDFAENDLKKHFEKIFHFHENGEKNKEEIMNLIQTKCKKLADEIPILCKTLDEKIKADEESDMQIINLI